MSNEEETLLICPYCWAELKEHKANSCLDRWVAEEAMGWVDVGGVWMKPDKHGMEERYPVKDFKPSTVMAIGMTWLWDKMVSKGWTIGIMQVRQEFTLKFFSEKSDMHVDLICCYCRNGDKKIDVCGKTIPLALCYALLLEPVVEPSLDLDDDEYIGKI